MIGNLSKCHWLYTFINLLWFYNLQEFVDWLSDVFKVAGSAFYNPLYPHVCNLQREIKISQIEAPNYELPS